MNKEFVLNTIQASKTWEAGQCLSFRHTICGNEWDLIIRKEENIYFPYYLAANSVILNTISIILRNICLKYTGLP